MPAFNNTLQFPASNNWTLVTQSDIDEITFLNTGGTTWWLAATSGATPPAGRSASIPISPGKGEQNLSLADAFPGIGGGNRLYVLAPKGGQGFFSHA